ncbi:MAG: hypothetical protein QXW71_05230 [Thermoplasmata archaeon]
MSVILDFAEWIRNSIMNFFSWVGESISNVLGYLWGAIQQFIAWIVDNVINFINWLNSVFRQSVINPLVSAINSVIKRIVERIDRIILLTVVLPSEIKLVKKTIEDPSMKNILSMIFAPIFGYVGSVLVRELLRQILGTGEGIQIQLPEIGIQQPVLSLLERKEICIEDEINVSDNISTKVLDKIITINMFDQYLYNDTLLTNIINPITVQSQDQYTLSDICSYNMISPITVQNSDEYTYHGDITNINVISPNLIQTSDNYILSDNVTITTQPYMTVTRYIVSEYSPGVLYTNATMHIVSEYLPMGIYTNITNYIVSEYSPT